MAEVLEVSWSGYYAWLARRDGPAGPLAVRRAQLSGKVLAAHTVSDGVNGALRILADLRAAGKVVSRKTVAKLMRAHGIAGVTPGHLAPGDHGRRRVRAQDPRFGRARRRPWPP